MWHLSQKNQQNLELTQDLCISQNLYISMGGNTGPVIQNMCAALEHMAMYFELSAVSSVYETAPMYDVQQPSFLNAVVALRTSYEPTSVLAMLQDIEHQSGRIRQKRYGPRPLDLDILYHGNRVIAMPLLQLPHPRIQERAFVLFPLSDIAPDFVDPRTHKTVRQMKKDLGSSGIAYDEAASATLHRAFHHLTSLKQAA